MKEVKVKSEVIKSEDKSRLDLNFKQTEICVDDNDALVVDDEPINVIMMRAQAKYLGFKCDSTVKSAKVVQLVKDRIAKVKRGEAQMYKLFLIDYSMPELDGLQLIKMLREILKENELMI